MFHSKKSGGGPTGYTDLAVDMFQMRPHGSFGDEESLAHLPPIEAFSYQTEHVNLSIGEPGRPFLLTSLLSVGAIFPTQVPHESLESFR